ncbi:hypothetical protein [Agromyces lapidis]|uniref:Uncharacterized protein n=1 Tax=Agromyces lapidis TaxID=279574 RepID=A0ABV5SPA8_9MICO|nr:hypothetical protein [Agromyces lapidis]
MSEWPETLVEKVAIAIFQWDIEEHDEPKPIWTGLNDVQRDVWRSGATAALDALGLREETRDSWNPRDIERRFVTPWEDV